MLNAVVTTIQRPTPALESLGRCLAAATGASEALIVIGDRKGPDVFEMEGARFFDLSWQLGSNYSLARTLPIGHYARKNIGYLEAIRSGASCIYETDDDNAPGPNWAPRSLNTAAHVLRARSQWVNVYRCFTDQLIWPRGLPLDEIGRQFDQSLMEDVEERVVCAPIQQGLANHSPDVDAVWRLVLDAPFTFDSGPSVQLQPGAWCPFNSQSTWWWPDAYPLLYLPSHCSFRMTDIWRSFIAQRCLWELDMGVVFHAPEVVQDRNPHDLMRDFNDEISGYQQNRNIVSVLEALPLQRGADKVVDNLRACYVSLIEKKVFPLDELKLLDLWIAGLQQSG